MKEGACASHDGVKQYRDVVLQVMHKPAESHVAHDFMRDVQLILKLIDLRMYMAAALPGGDDLGE